MRWKQTLESNRRKQIEDENVRASCWKTKRKEKSFSFLLPLDGSDAGETRVSFYPRCSCSFDNNLTTFRDKKRERIGGNSSEDGRRIVIIVSGRATLFNPWECFMFRHLCHLPPVWVERALTSKGCLLLIRCLLSTSNTRLMTSTAAPGRSHCFFKCRKQFEMPRREHG